MKGNHHAKKAHKIPPGLFPSRQFEGNSRCTSLHLHQAAALQRNSCAQHQSDPVLLSKQPGAQLHLGTWWQAAQGNFEMASLELEGVSLGLVQLNTILLATFPPGWRALANFAPFPSALHACISRCHILNSDKAFYVERCPLDRCPLFSVRSRQIVDIGHSCCESPRLIQVR
jgi:hypothetical protein